MPQLRHDFESIDHLVIVETLGRLVKRHVSGFSEVEFCKSLLPDFGLLPSSLGDQVHALADGASVDAHFAAGLAHRYRTFRLSGTLLKHLSIPFFLDLFRKSQSFASELLAF
jgi:hypothetical protein